MFAASVLVAAAVSVSVSVAAREVTGNLLSGLVIVADRSINYGDWVRTAGTEGTIDDIGFRATRVRTFDNELVTIPDSALVDRTVTNVGYQDVLRMTQPVAVDYDSDFEEGLDLMEAAARENEGILDIPEPSAVFVSFGGPAVNLEARFWIAGPARVDVVAVRTEYAAAVDRRLSAAGIQIQPPSPTELSGELEVVERSA